MSENSALPPCMIALGEALHPIVSKLHAQMDAPTRRTLGACAAEDSRSYQEAA